MKRDLYDLIEKAKDYDKVTVSREYDPNLDYSYAIDIEDSSVFYTDPDDRDRDYEELKNYVETNRDCFDGKVFFSI